MVLTSCSAYSAITVKRPKIERLNGSVPVHCLLQDDDGYTPSPSIDPLLLMTTLFNILVPIGLQKYIR
jgi:hypothetical protein